MQTDFSETSTIARNFQDEGFDVDFEEVADMYVINTCSVTENADKQFKQVVKKSNEIQ
jgi:threonylcarbamoyladenosine tRNA methylthiotransferase MtaB